jgi:hypothetical protein
VPAEALTGPRSSSVTPNWPGSTPNCSPATRSARSFLTSAAESGAGVLKVVERGSPGHKSIEMLRTLPVARGPGACRLDVPVNGSSYILMKLPIILKLYSSEYCEAS